MIRPTRLNIAVGGEHLLPVAKHALLMLRTQMERLKVPTLSQILNVGEGRIEIVANAFGIDSINIVWQGAGPHGFICWPASDEARYGWGTPFVDAEGKPINPPLGTVLSSLQNKKEKQSRIILITPKKDNDYKIHRRIKIGSYIDHKWEVTTGRKQGVWFSKSRKIILTCDQSYIYSAGETIAVVDPIGSTGMSNISGDIRAFGVFLRDTGNGVKKKYLWAIVVDKERIVSCVTKLRKTIKQIDTFSGKKDYTEWETLGEVDTTDGEFLYEGKQTKLTITGGGVNESCTEAYLTYLMEGRNKEIELSFVDPDNPEKLRTVTSSENHDVAGLMTIQRSSFSYETKYDEIFFNQNASVSDETKTTGTLTQVINWNGASFTSNRGETLAASEWYYSGVGDFYWPQGMTTLTCVWLESSVFYPIIAVYPPGNVTNYYFTTYDNEISNREKTVTTSPVGAKIITFDAGYDGDVLIEAKLTLNSLERKYDESFDYVRLEEPGTKSVTFTKTQREETSNRVDFSWGDISFVYESTNSVRTFIEKESIKITDNAVVRTARKEILHLSVMRHFAIVRTTEEERTYEWDGVINKYIATYQKRSEIISAITKDGEHELLDINKQLDTEQVGRTIDFIYDDLSRFPVADYSYHVDKFIPCNNGEPYSDTGNQKSRFTLKESPSFNLPGYIRQIRGVYVPEYSYIPGKEKDGGEVIGPKTFYSIAVSKDSIRNAYVDEYGYVYGDFPLSDVENIRWVNYLSGNDPVTLSEAAGLRPRFNDITVF